MGPDADRTADLSEALLELGLDVEDLGNMTADPVVHTDLPAHAYTGAELPVEVCPMVNFSLPKTAWKEGQWTVCIDFLHTSILFHSLYTHISMRLFLFYIFIFNINC